MKIKYSGHNKMAAGFTKNVPNNSSYNIYVYIIRIYKIHFCGFNPLKNIGNHHPRMEVGYLPPHPVTSPTSRLFRKISSTPASIICCAKSRSLASAASRAQETKRCKASKELFCKPGVAGGTINESQRSKEMKN